MNDVQIAIGVKGFQFFLKHPCQKDAKVKISITLSFELTGNFLEACKSDNLIDTTDYESMCRQIVNTLEHSDCSDNLDIIERVENTVKRCSYLITGGCYDITLHCHDTFTTGHRLL